MLKSKIRKKILKIRKNKNKGKIHIKFSKIYSLLKKKTNLKRKIIGGYYPVNYEVDDLEILKKFAKKKIKISLPVVKKNFGIDFILCSLDVLLKFQFLFLYCLYSGKLKILVL